MQEYVFERIKERRKHLKWSQEKLAKKTGLARVHLSYVETGKLSPKVTTITRIANAMDVNVGYFFRKKLHV